MDIRAPTARARIVAVSGRIGGEVVALEADECTIGRDPSNAICLADRSLSRSHCSLSKSNGSWVIRDAGSANGTFVNGIQIRDLTLHDGDQIKVGESVFVFVLREPGPEPEEIRLESDSAGLSCATSRLRIEDSEYVGRAGAGPLPATPGVERNLRGLLRLSTTLAEARDEGALCSRLLDLLFEIVPADAGAAVLVDAASGIAGAYPRERAGHPPVPVNERVLAQALREGVGILRRDTSIGSTPGTIAGLVSASVRSLICVPLASRGRTLGALYIASADSAAFDDTHLQFVTAVAAIASIALDNVQHLVAVEREAARLRADLHVEHDLVGRSEPMQRVYELVAKLARSDTTVLILGETGTGKELVARALHRNSARARRPFVSVNCAALTETLIESELFGHERGAFTGAFAQKRGKLEAADGGTVFLDEVGELAPVLQTKLLRVLQQREFERVGATRSIKVDIRIVSATNSRLADAVAAGRFREDLLFRLNVVSIDVPPLRERREDIPALVEHFVARFSRAAGRPVRGLTAPALRRLSAYDWPGNVRELENAIERAVVLGSSEWILPQDLPESLLEAPAAPGRELTRYHEAVQEAKRRVIVDAFRASRHSYVETARALGLHPNYLHRVIRNLELKPVLEGEP